MHKGKVAIITGGTRGIGKAIAQHLARLNCNVVLLYLSDHETAQVTASGINEMNRGRATTLQCHIADGNSRKQFWADFTQQFDQVDYFIANAATGVFRGIETLTLNSMQKVFATNFEAFFDMAKECVKRMPAGSQAPGAKGRIVSISSLGAERVIANYTSVAASKAAIEALTRQFAAEYGGQGINANVVRAGLVDTGILNYLPDKNQIIEETIRRTPNGRLVTPQDVAELVAFMLSPASAMINGQTIMVDGGFNILA